MVLIYVLLAIVSSPLIITRLYANNHETYYILSHGLDFIKAVVLLVSMGLFANTTYRQQQLEYNQVLSEV